MKKILAVTQLSNYDTHGKFLLHCDSGWQMVINRARVMLSLDSDLKIDVTAPLTEQCLLQPEEVNPDLFEKFSDRLRVKRSRITPNALATRYEFDVDRIALDLNVKDERYTSVYVNDPMLLRHYKALFLLKTGYKPKFLVHSHFVDVPTNPKFPQEASLWLGQLEAALRADFNFWQCESAFKEFEVEARKVFRDTQVDEIMAKSLPWDDGYSTDEINSEVNVDKLRFDQQIFNSWKSEGKIVIFVPNRIGGRGRSSDYTQCGKFMFEILPKLRQSRDDFVVICGNPSQKIFNRELEDWCGKDGYVSLVEDAFNRDEYKVVARNSDISVGLYEQDTYGGTSARECVELGCLPLFVDKNEYSLIAKKANYPFLCKQGLTDIIHVMNELFTCLDNKQEKLKYLNSLQQIVREQCSFEQTTEQVLRLFYAS